MSKKIKIKFKDADELARFLYCAHYEYSNPNALDTASEMQKRRFKKTANLVLGLFT